VDGAIDIALHKWKRNDNDFGPAPRNKFGQYLCPVCASEGDDQLLATLIEQEVLACPKWHAFQLGSIPNDQ
jgi:hypothetical protein